MTGVNVISSGLINRQPHSVGLTHEDLDIFGQYMFHHVG